MLLLSIIGRNHNCTSISLSSQERHICHWYTSCISSTSRRSRRSDGANWDRYVRSKGLSCSRLLQAPQYDHSLKVASPRAASYSSSFVYWKLVCFSTWLCPLSLYTPNTRSADKGLIAKMFCHNNFWSTYLQRKGLQSIFLSVSAAEILPSDDSWRTAV